MGASRWLVLADYGPFQGVSGAARRVIDGLLKGKWGENGLHPGIAPEAVAVIAKKTQRRNPLMELRL